MMTQEEQRIALNEWCGVKKYLGHDSPNYQTDYQQTVWSQFRHRNSEVDFPNDLNAMYEAELKLGDKWCVYYTHFVDDGGVKINASAAQRAEALCRTLWPERFQ